MPRGAFTAAAAEGDFIQDFLRGSKRVEEGPFRKGRHALQLQLSTLVVLHVKKQPALGRGLAAPVIVALGCQGRVEPPFSEFITQ